jgi:hypothetical protein
VFEAVEAVIIQDRLLEAVRLLNLEPILHGFASRKMVLFIRAVIL